MPLSRLTPRSSRTGVARQKTNTRAQADSQRHLHLWAAIRKTREELDQWNRQVQQVDALFNHHIAPREYKLTQAVCNVTEQLILQFAENELEIPDKSLLGLWITDNLNSLQDHPFADKQQTKLLSTRWLEQLNNDGPVENQLARLARKNNFNAQGQQDQQADIRQPDDEALDGKDSEDSQGVASQNEHRQGKKNPSASNDSISTDSESDDTKSDNEKTAPPIEDTIKTLEDKLSVERLFRQLAKALHPDREQDEDVKAAKHVLMSQCLKARQDKDIHALLTLYCEHVGELPDDLNNNSHNELVSALEEQLKQLQIELREKRFGDPLHTMIVERYSSATTADSEQRIKNHAQSLDNEITTAEELVCQLQAHEGLLDALDERRAVEQDRMAINEMTGM